MIVNVSQGKENYSQRNNAIKPLESCNVTSMVMALSYLDYTFPKGRYDQPEDNLREYLESKNMNPEVHAPLSKGTNDWMGRIVTKFSMDVPIPTIIENIQMGRPVVMSGTFPGYPAKRPKPLGHIVTLVGFEWEGDKPKGKPIAAIIDDPYGDTLNNWQGNGNDIKIAWDLFIDWMKPCGNSAVKWGHLFYTK